MKLNNERSYVVSSRVGIIGIILIFAFAVGYVSVESRNDSMLQANIISLEEPAITDHSCHILDPDVELKASLDAVLVSLRDTEKLTLSELAAADPIVDHQVFSYDENSDFHDESAQQSILATVKETYGKQWDLKALVLDPSNSQLSPLEIESSELDPVNSGPIILSFQQTAPVTGLTENVPVEDAKVALIIQGAGFYNDTLIDRYVQDIVPQEAVISAGDALSQIEKYDGELYDVESQLVYYPIPFEEGDTISSHTLTYKITFTQKENADPDVLSPELIGSTFYVSAQTGNTLLTEEAPLLKFYDEYLALPHYIQNPQSDCELQKQVGYAVCENRTQNECDPIAMGSATSITFPDSVLKPDGSGTKDPMIAAKFFKVNSVDVIADTYPAYGFFTKSLSHSDKDTCVPNSDSRAPEYLINSSRYSLAASNALYHLGLAQTDSDSLRTTFEPRIDMVPMLHELFKRYKVSYPNMRVRIYPTIGQTRLTCGQGALACTKFSTKKDVPHWIYLDIYSALDNEVIYNELGHVFVRQVNPILSNSKFLEAKALDTGLSYFFALASTMQDKRVNCRVGSCSYDQSKYSDENARCMKESDTCVYPTLEGRTPGACFSDDPEIWRIEDAPYYRRLWKPINWSGCWAHGGITWSEMSAYQNCLVSNNFRSPHWQSDFCSSVIGNGPCTNPVLPDSASVQDADGAVAGHPISDSCYNATNCYSSGVVNIRKWNATAGYFEETNPEVSCTATPGTYTDVYEYGDYSAPYHGFSATDITDLYKFTLAAQSKQLAYVPFQQDPDAAVEGAKVAAILLRFDEYLRQTTAPSDATMIAYTTARNKGIDTKEFTDKWNINRDYYYPAVVRALREISEDVTRADEFYPLIPRFYALVYQNLSDATEDASISNSVRATLRIALAHFGDMLRDDAKVDKIIGNSQYLPEKNILTWSDSCVPGWLEPVYQVHIPPFMGITKMVRQVTLQFIDPVSGEVLDSHTFAVSPDDFGKPSKKRTFAFTTAIDSPVHVRFVLDDLKNGKYSKRTVDLKGNILGDAAAPYFTPINPLRCGNSYLTLGDATNATVFHDSNNPDAEKFKEFMNASTGVQVQYIQMLNQTLVSTAAQTHFENYIIQEVTQLLQSPPEISLNELLQGMFSKVYAAESEDASTWRDTAVSWGKKAYNYFYPDYCLDGTGKLKSEVIQEAREQLDPKSLRCFSSDSTGEIRNASSSRHTLENYVCPAYWDDPEKLPADLTTSYNQLKDRLEAAWTKAERCAAMTPEEQTIAKCYKGNVLTQAKDYLKYRNSKRRYLIDSGRYPYACVVGRPVDLAYKVSQVVLPDLTNPLEVMLLAGIPGSKVAKTTGKEAVNATRAAMAGSVEEAVARGAAREAVAEGATKIAKSTAKELLGRAVKKERLTAKELLQLINKELASLNAAVAHKYAAEEKILKQLTEARKILSVAVAGSTERGQAVARVQALFSELEEIQFGIKMTQKEISTLEQTVTRIEKIGDDVVNGTEFDEHNRLREMIDDSLRGLPSVDPKLLANDGGEHTRALKRQLRELDDIRKARLNQVIPQVVDHNIEQLSNPSVLQYVQIQRGANGLGDAYYIEATVRKVDGALIEDGFGSLAQNSTVSRYVEENGIARKGFERISVFGEVKEINGVATFTPQAFVGLGEGISDEVYDVFQKLVQKVMQPVK